ncbi:MAG: Gfo/Idh/MocA family oxidoreductase [Roseburia sp.]|nr:Gfo/Idh/MocA family oxidoreductase [Roseburia sp.]MCM1201659.1 Gfo/Idh/MocA family oxidoreductase [Bacteroides fragilis]
MKICVVGLGSMGKRRIRLLRLLFDDLTITGIDCNENRAQSAACEYGIDCYSTLADITEEPDCVFICTSPRLHAPIIKECLERNLHVFSEINLIDDLYDENIRLAKQKGKILFLSSTPLYREEMQIIDSRIKQNGNPCAYRYHVGQYLPDWHPWDNLKDFFVSDKKTNGCREILAIELPWIQNVFGEIKKLHVVRTKLTDLKLDFPDTYFIQLEHSNGSIGNLTIDVVSRQAVRKLEIFNEGLYITWDGTPETLYEKDIISGELKQISAGEYIHEEGYSESINEYAYMKETEAFFRVIKGEKPLYSFEKDKEILKIIDKIEN